MNNQTEKLFRAIGMLDEEEIAIAREPLKSEVKPNTNVITVTPSMFSAPVAESTKRTRSFSRQFMPVAAAMLVLAIGTVVMFSVLSHGNNPVSRNPATTTTPSPEQYNPLSVVEHLWLVYPSFGFTIGKTGIGYCEINDVYFLTYGGTVLDETTSRICVDGVLIGETDELAPPEIAWSRERNVVGRTTTIGDNGKLGIVDSDGNVLVPFVFDLIKLIDEHTAFAGVETCSPAGIQIMYGIIRIPALPTAADFEIREAQRLQLQRWIESYLNNIPEIENSQVILQMPLTCSYIAIENREEVRAAVTLTMNEGQSLTEEQIRGVYLFILNNVKELDMANIVFVDENGLPIMFDVCTESVAIASGRGEGIIQQITPLLDTTFGEGNYTLSIHNTDIISVSLVIKTESMLPAAIEAWREVVARAVGTDIENVEIAVKIV
jgi:hypothetical protein